MNFRAAKKSAGDIYINEPVETDKDGNTMTLIDIIDDGVDIHEQVELTIRSKQLYRFLASCLDERETELIVYRYGLYGGAPHTQNETAEKLGISRSYVSRIDLTHELGVNEYREGLIALTNEHWRTEIREHAHEHEKRACKK